jgi:hypothetical protein
MHIIVLDNIFIWWVLMRTIDNRYKYADSHGGYTLFFGECTIEVKVIGFLSQSLLDKFCDDLGMMLGVIEWKYWGYYGDLSECDEKSPITQEILVNLRKRFYKKGCIAEAYTITHPITIENVVRLKKAEGLDSSIDNNLFPDRSQAIEFIQNVLSRIKNKSPNSE